MSNDIGVDLYELTPELRTLVDNELDRDEKIVWLGRPDPKASGRGYLAVQLFAIPWTAFSVFWIGMAAGWKIPDFKQGFDFFPLFGIPFFLIGIGMLTSPIWGKRLASKSVYVLTNRRAIIFKKEFTGMSIRSFNPDQLRTLERKQHADGSGDLIFKQEITGHSDSGPHIGQVGFLGVANVKQVEDLVEQLAASV
jgi:hypothetical protein